MIEFTARWLAITFIAVTAAVLVNKALSGDDMNPTIQHKEAA